MKKTELSTCIEAKKVYWTRDLVTAEAKKFSSRSQFQKNSPGAYGRAFKMGWLDSACSHMQKRRVKWTLEEVRAEAQKYSTKIDFNKMSGSAYARALKMGWLNDVCSHMSRPNTFTEDDILSEAKKYLTRNDFFQSAPSVYNAAKRLQIFEKATAHMTSSFIMWTEEQILQEAAKHASFSDFYKKNQKAYSAAKRLRILDTVRNLFGHARLTKENCIAVAKQYTTRKEFERSAKSHYSFASYHGFLNEACQHMQSQRINWTPDLVKAKASEYPSVLVFKEQCPKGHAFAKRHGLLESLVFQNVTA